MTCFSPLQFDPALCRAQLADLQGLLSTQPELSEQKDLQPLLKKSEHLAAAMSWYAARMPRPDRLAFEFDLFGRFTCDLVVGDSSTGRFCFIEFEDARANSVFVPTKSRPGTPDWSPRFEHGYSQILDWFWLLRDGMGSQQMEAAFGKRDIFFDGLLVVGRSQFVQADHIRLEWRREHVIVDSKKVLCFTWDEVADDIAKRLDEIDILARPTDM